MKKQMTKLTLNRETLRDLGKKDLSNALGGAINVRSLNGDCPDGSFSCTGNTAYC